MPHLSRSNTVLAIALPLVFCCLFAETASAQLFKRCRLFQRCRIQRCVPQTCCNPCDPCCERMLGCDGQWYCPKSGAKLGQIEDADGNAVAYVYMSEKCQATNSSDLVLEHPPYPAVSCADTTCPGNSCVRRNYVTSLDDRLSQSATPRTVLPQGLNMQIAMQGMEAETRLVAAGDFTVVCTKHIEICRGMNTVYIQLYEIVDDDEDVHYRAGFVTDTPIGMQVDVTSVTRVNMTNAYRVVLADSSVYAVFDTPGSSVNLALCR